MKLFIILSCAAIISFAAGCSSAMDDLMPASLDGTNSTRLVAKYRDKKAAGLFRDDPLLSRALDEFVPRSVSAGVYDYGGITVRLGVARCENPDDSYGIYSALAAMPRERWPFGAGELSYRSPYVSGRSGEYVFWIYSPTNPMTYADFYRRHGEAILKTFDRVRKPGDGSYHWKILPRENRYADSIFFIRSRTVRGLQIAGAYAATYQAQTNVARIYAMKYDSEAEAESMFSEYVKTAAAIHGPVETYLPMPAAPAKACRWKEKAGTQVLCQYRWMIFYLEDLPSNDAGINFLRIIFRNMQNVREEAMGKKVK